MIRFLRVALLAGTALLAASSTGAQTLETVTVTARQPDPVGNEAFSVMTLDAGDLKGATQLDTALSQVPGLSLFRRDSSLSANPTTQGVSLRSIAPSGAGRALVTLDGVPLNDPFGGWVIWSQLPPEAIAKAEVVRGAGAGPYGAGALTGTIALSENEAYGFTGDASAGELSSQRIAAAGGTRMGTLDLFGSLSEQTSGGWIPLSPAQRGAADNNVTLDSRQGSLRMQFYPLAGTTVAVRVSGYGERRHSGLAGIGSKANGTAESVTIAHPESAQDLGWRLQLWLRDSDFANTSGSVPSSRASVTPANDQYATPASGWGANAALRGQTGWLNWEVGSDVRGAEGESREHYLFSGGSFTKGRVSGGKSFVGGVYGEGAARFDDWLITLGLRADQWQTSQGHLIERTLATNAITANTQYPDKSGIIPSARLGVRRALGDGLYARAAAYSGFRAPTLNELYRPFRVGNVTTQANADLIPERLYGVETGIGGDHGAFSWSATLFYNQLHHAIANVTIGTNLQQRRNAGDINATGIEAEARYVLSDDLAVHLAFDGIDASIHGKRPAQAPRWTIAGGIDATLFPDITASADIRYESNRFADDLNTLPLGTATTVNARIEWAATKTLSLYAAADNLLDSNTATTAQVDSTTLATITSYSAPRVIRAGLRLTLD